MKISIDISFKKGITKKIHIDASSSLEEIQTYKAVFQESHDIFSWSNEEMRGIEHIIVPHEIRTYLNAKNIKQ